MKDLVSSGMEQDPQLNDSLRVGQNEVFSSGV